MSLVAVSTTTMILASALVDAAFALRLVRLRRLTADSAPMTCLCCYTTSAPVQRKRGSAGTAMAVLLGTLAGYGAMFILLRVHVRVHASAVLLGAFYAIQPFLAYQLWRANGRVRSCVACGHRELIPSDTPRAQSLRLRAWCDRQADAVAGRRA